MFKKDTYDYLFEQLYMPDSLDLGFFSHSNVSSMFKYLPLKAS